MRPVRAVGRRLRQAWRRLSAAAEAGRRGVRRGWLRRRARPVADRFPAPRRLHLGCGDVALDGWINLDDRDLPGVDLVWDLRDPVPLADGSVRFIYQEHLIEHLEVDDGVRLLRDSRRLLTADGVLRIATPSLDSILEKSCSGDWRDQDWLIWPVYRSIDSRAEMLNVVFRWWGHRWLYDREELHRRLREAGFGTVRDVAWGESEHPELRGLETRADSLLICEASP